MGYYYTNAKGEDERAYMRAFKSLTDFLKWDRIEKCQEPECADGKPRKGTGWRVVNL